MIYKIITTKQADLDLRGIYEYIAFKLLSVENAKKQLDRLEKSIISLNEFPEKFKLYEQEPWFSKGIRVMPVDNYLVFYVVNKDKKTVTIIRIMYNGRDVDSQLNTLYNN